MKNIFLSFLALILLAGCATKDKNNSGTVTDDTTNTANYPTTGDKAANQNSNTTDPAVTTPAEAVDANATRIQWIDPVVKEMGTLKKDKSVEITYRFKNVGDKPLVIENVTAQCGCTIPEKPQQPFAPGEEGVIKATFNGVGHGMISKQVYVTTNTNPKSHTLTFNGEIK